MADVTNCRMFLLGRYYYDFKHKLIVEHGRLVKDTHYDYNDQIIGVSYFDYVTDTPNYKKIVERIYDYVRHEKRFIYYYVDYKHLTETHIHRDYERFEYLNLKYIFKEINGKKELMRVRDLNNLGFGGWHFFRDVNNERIPGSVYIHTSEFQQGLKMTKEEFAEYKKCRGLYRKDLYLLNEAYCKAKRGKYKN